MKKTLYITLFLLCVFSFNSKYCKASTEESTATATQINHNSSSSEYPDVSIVDIFFSNTEPIVGSTVKIYVVAKSENAKDSLGQIALSVKEEDDTIFTSIGIPQDISIFSKSTDGVFFDWITLKPGFYEFKATALVADDPNLSNNVFYFKPLVVDVDTDGDGINDYYDDDDDNDGLKDIKEEEIGTDPLNPDTDGDGLNDGKEVNETKTDPLIADTDKDGLNDGKEVNETKTNPLNPDTDYDTVCDLTEVEDKTNPLVIDRVESFKAKWISQTQGTSGEINAPLAIGPGKTIAVEAQFENVGKSCWQNSGVNLVGFYVYKDLKYSTPPEYNNINNPLFGTSQFADTSWGTSYNGKTPNARAASLKEKIILPGKTGSFQFTFTAASDFVCKTRIEREDLTLAFRENWMDADAPYPIGTGDPLGKAHVWFPLSCN